MAEFKIDGRMKVKKLKESFKNEFNGILRVYNGRNLADDDATLASIRCNDEAKGGELTCRASRTVGKFIEEMWESFGIKVKIASPDDFVLVLDGITLSNIKNIKPYAKKADMEELIAYKHEETVSDEVSPQEDQVSEVGDVEQEETWEPVFAEDGDGNPTTLSFNDEDGVARLVFEPYAYGGASKMKNGYALIDSPNGLAVIDSKGNETLVEDFDDYLDYLLMDDLDGDVDSGSFDKNGNIIIVTQDEMYGVVNKDGKIIIPLDYSRITRTENGFVAEEDYDKENQIYFNIYGEGEASEQHENSSGDVEWIDMGGSVLWASCNVGAVSPEDYGDYFAFAEREPKEIYEEDNCLTQYIDDLDAAADDCPEIGDPGAYRYGDDNCYTPSHEEFQELKENCDGEWTTQNGVAGVRFTSRATGNILFFPAAGWNADGNTGSVGEQGFYWTSTDNTYWEPGDDYNSIYMLLENVENPLRTCDAPRYNGFSVRSVKLK